MKPPTPSRHGKRGKLKPAYTLVEARRVDVPGSLLAIEIPVRLVNELNKHEDWRIRLRRSRAQKAVVESCLRLLGGPRPALPVVVEMTGIRPRLLDTDGAVSSCKWVRDAVAEWLGCKDSPKDPIDWVVWQKRGEPRTYGVLVVVKDVSP